MIELKNKTKCNFVHLKSNDVSVGCGFIFDVNEETYCVTAGHVVFGKRFDKERNIDFFDINNNKLEKIERMSDITFAKNYDLALYKVYEDISNINKVRMCRSIVNSKLLSISYMKSSTLSDPFFLDIIKFNDELDDNIIRYSTKANSFSNFQDDEHGAEAMEGISGSPIVLCSWDNTIVFHGIVTKIPNKGVGDFIDARSLLPLKDLIAEIEFYDRDEFDSSHKLIRFNSKLFEKEKFNNWVDAWKELPLNKDYYNNLVKKLRAIHGEDFHAELHKELEKIMIGDECFTNVIEKNSTLYDSYQDIVETAERDKMEKHVSTRSEALGHYQNVYENHLRYINDDLSKYELSRTDKRKIAQYNIATWMAVCNLRFEIK
ncbi:hypothetical protein [Vibrio algarum]|uniref:Trypsin-like peptidase domain-containing protein n=1 Tax=Vibrio algarum TaxID=3020714 RepID=A0ABT4YPC1_9VIBR|nr:hypothetical protein [Vibrio sp. KJ40-1]MDB1123402.1 hypothetical protein [Vibrio sp. KJ40-1]